MDRFHRGLIAGIAGGIIMNIWGLISYSILQFADISFLDWSSLIIFGYKPISPAHYIIALIGQLLWAGFLGIIIAYIVPHISSQGYLIKGIVLGFITSFFIYAVPVMFNIHDISDVSLGTAVTDIVGGMMWGATVMTVLRRMEIA